MRIAILIQCHCNPEQINLFLEVLQSEEIDFFIHVDKKSNIQEKIDSYPNVYFVPNEKRVDVRWGTFSQVEATLTLINLAREHGIYNYFWLCSGQDFPIKSKSEILSFFEQNNGCEFLHLFESKMLIGKSTNFDKRNEIVYPKWLLKRGRIVRILRRFWVEITGGYKKTWAIFKRKNKTGFNFYFGSQWWCLSGQAINYICAYLKMHPEYSMFFSQASCPDESFFQTLIMNSVYAQKRKNYLHYIDWKGCKNSPRVLSIEDLESMLQSDFLIGRKCDMRQDNGLVQNIYQQIKKEG